MEPVLREVDKADQDIAVHLDTGQQVAIGPAVVVGLVRAEFERNACFLQFGDRLLVRIAGIGVFEPIISSVVRLPGRRPCRGTARRW